MGSKKVWQTYLRSVVSLTPMTDFPSTVVNRHNSMQSYGSTVSQSTSTSGPETLHEQHQTRQHFLLLETGQIAAFPVPRFFAPPQYRVGF